MKNFTIMMFTVATTSMSDDTSYMDEDLPTFDRNTLENIMMCSANDAEDMRKLNQLCQKLFGEIEKRALACQKFLVTEQKIIDDEHHMYPEHAELLPWVVTNLPVDLPSMFIPDGIKHVYTTYYDYLKSLVDYLKNTEV